MADQEKSINIEETYYKLQSFRKCLYASLLRWEQEEVGLTEEEIIGNDLLLGDLIEQIDEYMTVSRFPVEISRKEANETPIKEV
jgi:hypothetical protein